VTLITSVNKPGSCDPIRRDRFSLKINGVPLKQISNNHDEKSSKFLGVLLDESLSWKGHLNYVNAKISRALFAIKQIKNILPISSLRTLYHSMIHPHISYGILAWGNAASKNLNRTTILQKRAIRIINRTAYNSHTEPLFKKSCILKLKDLHDYVALQLMYKYHNKRLPISFMGMFSYNRDIQLEQNTRQSHLMYIERCQSSFSSRLPRYSFPILWNHLNMGPDYISPSQFRTNIKTTMLNSYADKVNCLNPMCRDCYK